MSGIYAASALLIRNGYKVNLEDLKKDGITLMKPFGKYIGVKDGPNNIEDEPENTDAVVEVGEIEPDGASISDYLVSKTIDVNGKEVHKATVARQLYIATPLSKDRCRRVEGLSQFGTTCDSQHDNDLVYIGDPVIVKQANRAFVANVKNIKIAQRTERSASVTLLGEESTLLLTVHEINLFFVVFFIVECDEEPGKLFWDKSYKGKSLEVSGQYVISVRPDVVVSPPPNMSMFCFNGNLVKELRTVTGRLTVGYRSLNAHGRLTGS